VSRFGVVRALLRFSVLRVIFLSPFLHSPQSVPLSRLAAALPYNGRGLLLAGRVMMRADLDELLKELRVRRLTAVRGANDWILGEADDAELEQEVPGATVNRMTACGHWSMIEQPAVVADHLAASRLW
jgi:pimeloyl-ACP methyl ester carboxylesterase